MRYIKIASFRKQI